MSFPLKDLERFVQCKTCQIKNYLYGVTGTQMKKESYSFKCQLKQCRSENWSENELKTVKWSLHLNIEEKYVLQSAQHKNKNGS